MQALAATHGGPWRPRRCLRGLRALGALPHRTTAAVTDTVPNARAPLPALWLTEREADLLPVGYFHVVFTLPTEIADIALRQNKADRLLFCCSARRRRR